MIHEDATCYLRVIFQEKTDINNIDWQGYVLDCLLFYADKIHSEALTVTRKCPTIYHWSSKKIRYRETFEQEIGSFGLGELSEEFVNEQVEEDIDVEDSNYDKYEDNYVEVIILNMHMNQNYKMLNSFERMKEKLNSKLNDAIKKFPKKESFMILKGKITNVIVGDKTEST
uniref:Uncharacterized protein n=1 Tax=Lactuca sativa TaxID=4236 RepID=A0A9R1UM82_LACSA|nr:hypothetical protein LSAT_V11C800407200 [Lactuca sativa]